MDWMGSAILIMVFELIRKARNASKLPTGVAKGGASRGFHAQTAGFFDALASGCAYDQAAGISSHTCHIMTPLGCFVLDALLHVDQSRGVGKQVFGDRRVALADQVAVVHENVCGKPLCRLPALSAPVAARCA